MESQTKQDCSSSGCKKLESVTFSSSIETKRNTNKKSENKIFSPWTDTPF